jgi:tetratricopeptide (TPR) repeat protein
MYFNLWRTEAKMRRPLIIPAVVVLLLFAAALLPAAPPPDKMAQADALLASPDLNFDKAQQALSLYEDLLQGNPRLFTRLARACFILGDLAPLKERAGYYERGLAYSKRALGQKPNGVEGHYWKAMNLSGLADVGTEMQGFRLLPKIMDELKKALELDETYDQAGAHRVIGRIYFQAPGWPISVGDRKESLQHLEAAVRLAPENSTNHLYLAETLLAMGYKTRAQDELEKALAAKHNAISPQDLEEDHREAKRLLDEMQKEK